MVEINSTNFVSSLELPFLCVCRIFSINALNQYNPSLESRVGKNMFSLSLNSLSKQIVQNQSVITRSLSSILYSLGHHHHHGDQTQVHLVSEHVWCDDYLVRSLYLKNTQTGETRTVCYQ